jgi:hypothetical protein
LKNVSSVLAKLAWLFCDLDFNQFVDVMLGFLQILDAVFLSPSRQILHRVAFQESKLVGDDVVPRLDRFRLVMVATVLDIVGGCDWCHCFSGKISWLDWVHNVRVHECWFPFVRICDVFNGCYRDGTAPRIRAHKIRVLKNHDADYTLSADYVHTATSAAILGCGL